MAESNPFLLVIPSSIAPGGGFLQDFRCVKQHLTLHEYQLYAVEQWVVDRNKHVPTIVVSTNDAAHKIIVDIWTPRADKVEGKAAIWDKTINMVRADGSRPKQTNLGYVLVVSLLGFRSDLSIVPLPDGDYLAAKEALFTNINLRRLGCGGRSGLTLSEASPSQQERFLQQYRLPSASASGPNFPLAVLRTIQLVQAALALFNMGPVGGDAQRLLEPDGLLCETTIASIGVWQVDVAFPLLGSELGESVLSSSVLAAILTIVIAVRCRLLTMGVHHIPSDPFVDRTPFLRSYSAFMKSTRNAPSSDYLTAEGIAHLRQQYTRTTKEFLKRAIRHRLDDIRGDGLSSGISKSAILEEETTDINVFVAAVKANGSSDLQSVVDLWKGKFKKNKSYGRRSDPWQGDEAAITVSEMSSGSDDEAGFGKLLKGVSRRTRKIGDGVTGLLDKTGVRTGIHSERDDLNRLRQHGQHQPRRTNDDRSMPMSYVQDENGLYRVSPFVAHASLSADTSPAGSLKDLLSIPGEDAHSPTGRPAHLRRSITDQGHSRNDSEHLLPSTLLVPRRRRHSLSSLRELPRFMHVMSVRRMRADVEMYTGFQELKSRETYFSHLVATLNRIDLAYEACLKNLGPTIQRRSNQMQALADRVKDLNGRVEAFTSTAGQTRDGRTRELSIGGESGRTDGKHHAIISLAVGTERLSYAQTVLEEKVREVSDFQKTLLNKIGGSEIVLSRSTGFRNCETPTNLAGEGPNAVNDASGIIVKGLIGLEESAAGKGTRKLLEVVGLWGNWLEYLKRRVQSYF